MDPNIDAQALAALTADLEGTSSEQAHQPNVAQPNYGERNAVTPSGDSFTNVDPATLPPQLQDLYRSMQADYTRKTQEIAPYRKLGMEPDALGNLVTWFNQVQNDPNAQLELYNALSDHLAQNGYLSANTEPNEPVNNETFFGATDEAETPATDDPLKNKVEQLSRWMAQQEEQAALNAAHMELMSMEQQIREANSHYTDDDIAEIYKLSLAHGGDLVTAESDYRALRDRIVGGYVNDKGGVVTAHAQPPATSPARFPERIENLREAEKAAIEMINRGDYDLWS